MMAISSPQRSAAARVALIWILVIAVSAVDVGAQSTTAVRSHRPVLGVPGQGAALEFYGTYPPAQ